MTSRTGPTYTLREIVERFGGEIVGDSKVRVDRVGTLENARAGAISFVSHERYFRQLRTTQATAVIVAYAAREATKVPRIVCANPHAYFARVSALLNPAPAATPGIHPTAHVHREASVDPAAEIGPYAVLARGSSIGPGTIVGPGCLLAEDVSIGSHARLYAAVTVYERCVIGDRVVIHSGTVIGADGFGIASEEGRWVKVPQVGRVRIGNDVEIGANTTIDRGAIDDTVIEDGVKLDNQIQVAHNVYIGAHTAIAACTGIASSVRIGRNCRIGGGVGIADHVDIADKVEVSGYTAITKSIPISGVYSGVYPFEANRIWRRNAAQLRHLSDLAHRVAALEERLAELTRSRS